MGEIILKQNQHKLIGVILGEGGSKPTYSSSDPALRGSREVFLREGSSPQGRTINNRLEIILAGENASVEVVGLVMSKGSDERFLETHIVHAAPNTKSKVIVKSVLRNKST